MLQNYIFLYFLMELIYLILFSMSIADIYCLFFARVDPFPAHMLEKEVSVCLLLDNSAEGNLFTYVPKKRL